MEVVSIIAATMGVAWASGINLYAAMLMLGWMGSTGQIDLPPGLEILQNPGVMLAAGLMYCVEFFADKVPGVDTGWDALHTFIRIPAGAMLASGAISPLGPEAEIIGLILGGSLSAGSHFTKAGGRVLINTSPEPVSNWTASISEDLLVIGGLWTALNHPVLFIILLVAFIALVVWLAPKIWRGIKAVFRKIGSWFSSGGGPAAGP
ncbi:MAG TPA: DUF4126 domain-containing protein, partial [Arenicellales bacterium]|nr:DUF4126 domain-containing protein [Arenicellales bacterium]